MTVPEPRPDDRESRAAFLRRAIVRHFPVDRSARILDLGCGDGTLLHFLREAGYGDVRGVDASPGRVATAHARGLGSVEHGDVRAFVEGVPDAEVDVVVAWDLLEHLPKTDLAPFASCVFRVLRPGGRWILHVPNAESPFGARVLYADFTHETAFTRESVAELAQAAGFARVDCFEDAPVVTGPHGLARWIVWRGIRAGLRLWLAAETGEPGAGAVFSRNLLAVAVKP